MILYVFPSAHHALLNLAEIWPYCLLCLGHLEQWAIPISIPKILQSSIDKWTYTHKHNHKHTHTHTHTRARASDFSYIKWIPAFTQDSPTWTFQWEAQRLIKWTCFSLKTLREPFRAALHKWVLLKNEAAARACGEEVDTAHPRVIHWAAPLGPRWVLGRFQELALLPDVRLKMFPHGGWQMPGELQDALHPAGFREATKCDKAQKFFRAWRPTMGRMQPG